MAKEKSKSVSFWRLSILELLILVGYVAIACGSLLNANEAWVKIIFSLLCLLVLILPIYSLAERGTRQIAALASLMAMGIYGFLWTYEPEVATKYGMQVENGRAISTELVDYQGYLPSSLLLNEMWRQVSGTYLYDTANGRVLSKHSSNYVSNLGFVPASNLHPGATFGQVTYKGLPEPNHFLPIGHCLMAMLWGYLSSKFAVWFYLRRLAREAKEHP